MKVCTWDFINGSKKYSLYIMKYVGGILCIHNNPDSVLTQIVKYFLLKPDSVGGLDEYLGAKLKPMHLSNCL